MISKPSTVECDSHGESCSFKCLSWTAVVAGALVGIGLTFLLNLFGVAIGLTAYSTSIEGTTSLAIGGFIGMAIGIMASMFVSGWVSGYLGRKTCLYPHLGVLYGFSSWSLSLIIMVVLAGSASEFMTMQYDKVTNPSILLNKISSTTSTMTVTEQTKNTTVATINNEKAAKMVGKSLFLIFILFFIGAITSAFGGYIGMKRDKDQGKIS